MHAEWNCSPLFTKIHIYQCEDKDASDNEWSHARGSHMVSSKHCFSMWENQKPQVVLYGLTKNQARIHNRSQSISLF